MGSPTIQIHVHPVWIAVSSGKGTVRVPINEYAVLDVPQVGRCALTDEESTYRLTHVRSGMCLIAGQDSAQAATDTVGRFLLENTEEKLLRVAEAPDVMSLPIAASVSQEDPYDE